MSTLSLLNAKQTELFGRLLRDYQAGRLSNRISPVGDAIAVNAQVGYRVDDRRAMLMTAHPLGKRVIRVTRPTGSDDRMRFINGNRVVEFLANGLQSIEPTLKQHKILSPGSIVFDGRINDDKGVEIDLRAWWIALGPSDEQLQAWRYLQDWDELLTAISHRDSLWPTGLIVPVKTLGQNIISSPSNACGESRRDHARITSPDVLLYPVAGVGTVMMPQQDQAVVEDCSCSGAVDSSFAAGFNYSKMLLKEADADTFDDSPWVAVFAVEQPVFGSRHEQTITFERGLTGDEILDLVHEDPFWFGLANRYLLATDDAVYFGRIRVFYGDYKVGSVDVYKKTTTQLEAELNELMSGYNITFSVTSHADGVAIQINLDPNHDVVTLSLNAALRCALVSQAVRVDARLSDYIGGQGRTVSVGVRTYGVYVSGTGANVEAGENYFGSFVDTIRGISGFGFVPKPIQQIPTGGGATEYVSFLLEFSQLGAVCNELMFGRLNYEITLSGPIGGSGQKERIFERENIPQDGFVYQGNQ